MRLSSKGCANDIVISATNACMLRYHCRAGNSRWELAAFLEERVKAGGGLVSIVRGQVSGDGGQGMTGEMTCQGMGVTGC